MMFRFRPIPLFFALCLVQPALPASAEDGQPDNAELHAERNRLRATMDDVFSRGMSADAAFQGYLAIARRYYNLGGPGPFAFYANGRLHAAVRLSEGSPRYDWLMFGLHESYSRGQGLRFHYNNTFRRYEEVSQKLGLSSSDYDLAQLYARYSQASVKRGRGR